MTTYCGYIAIIGRPNVGKSTLLNKILHLKLSITSNKPQTTRHKILGIVTQDQHQFVYVDTPGIHPDNQKTLNQFMNKTARSVLLDVDIIVFVIDSSIWHENDEHVLQILTTMNLPVILAINKIDKIKNKTQLLPLIAKLSQRYNFTDIVPISAKNGTQIDQLQKILKSFLPPSPLLFDTDQFTDRSTRFLCAELLREKIFRLCGEELPYATDVLIELFKEEAQLISINALILVEKSGHKRIIIGTNGDKLKEIASTARIDMEKLLNKKIYLRCWCKIKSGWSNDALLLKQLGYEDH